MKNSFSMKKIYFFICFIALSITSKAQFVTISDAIARGELKALFPSCFNGSDQLDTTCTTLLNTTSYTFNDASPSTVTLGLQYLKNLTNLTINSSIIVSHEFDESNQVYASAEGGDTITFPLNITKLKYINLVIEDYSDDPFYGDVSNKYYNFILQNFPNCITDLTSSNASLIFKTKPNNLKNLNFTRPVVSGIPAYSSGLQFQNGVPTSVEKLECTYCGHTNIKPLFPSVKDIIINSHYDELASSITFDIQDNLRLLSINGSSRNNIVLSKLKNIQSLSLSNVKISCLPLITDSLKSISLVNCRLFNNNTINCIPNENKYIFATTQFPLCTNLSFFCQLPPTAAKGKAYYDLNSNGIKDASEPFLPNVKIRNSNYSDYALTSNDSGKYVINMINNVTNTITATYNSPYFLSSFPTQYSYIPKDSVANPDTLNFGIRLKALNDLKTSVTSATAARPGFNTVVVGTLMNLTSKFRTDVSFKLIKPEGWTLNSTTPPASTISGDTLIWNNLSLNGIEQQNFEANLTLPATGTIIGNPFTYKTIAESPEEDLTPANDTALFSSIVRGSFDPNDKLVNPPTLTPGYDDSTDLIYTIRFQNTGNDTAFKVVIKDTILSKLKPETISIISASHDYKVVVYGENVMVITFDNILLVDSTTNEPASHGYITFSIKPQADLPIGEVFENKAAIYFDFNEPVITNIATTEVKVVNTVYNRNVDVLSVFPNPAKDKLRINWPASQQALLTITDISGKIIHTQIIQNGYTDIPVNQFQRGMYLIQALSGDKIAATKIILQ
jgi:uncharacterized repeat protein (TIGR01451 family)